MTDSRYVLKAVDPRWTPEQLLTIFRIAEEAGEVVQMASKLARFGPIATDMDSSKTEFYNNTLLLVNEVRDLNNAVSYFLALTAEGGNTMPRTKRRAPRSKPTPEPEEEQENLLDAEGEEIEEQQQEPIPEIEMYRVVPESPRIRALIYGEPGCGKTTLAATSQDHEEMAPVVFANIEGGLLSVAGRGDIHAVDITSTEALYDLYRKIKHREGLFAEVGTLVVDNITELQTLNLDEIVTAEVQAGNNGKRISVDDIWQEDYGVSTVQLGRLFRWLKGLDVNLVLTAHAKFVYPPSSNRNRQVGVTPDVEPIAVLPMITQKLMKTVMGLVDFCWYLEYDSESDKRHMLTRPDGIRQAKTRGPRFAEALGAVVIDPTMPTLYDTLVESESERARKPRRK